MEGDNSLIQSPGISWVLTPPPTVVAVDSSVTYSKNTTLAKFKQKTSLKMVGCNFLKVLLQCVKHPPSFNYSMNAPEVDRGCTILRFCANPKPHQYALENLGKCFTRKMLVNNKLLQKTKRNMRVIACKSWKINKINTCSRLEGFCFPLQSCWNSHKITF